MLELVPDAKDREGRRVHRVSNDIRAEHEITDCTRLGALLHGPAHFWEREQLFNAPDELGRDTGGCGRILFRNELPKANEILDGLR